jgi:uncharacterized DUF497 family protein
MIADQDYDDRIRYAAANNAFAEDHTDDEKGKGSSVKNSPWNPDDFRLIVGSTQVDYDSTKEEVNRKKNGYSLESAVHFFERLLPFHPAPFLTRDASTRSERRHEHMTIDDSGYVVFFVTTMRPDETVRIISLRRASPEEREVFALHTRFREALP